MDRNFLWLLFSLWKYSFFLCFVNVCMLFDGQSVHFGSGHYCVSCECSYVGVPPRFTRLSEGGHPPPSVYAVASWTLPSARECSQQFLFFSLSLPSPAFAILENREAASWAAFCRGQAESLLFLVLHLPHPCLLSPPSCTDISPASLGNCPCLCHTFCLGLNFV